jgi:hypothetical protein
LNIKPKTLSKSILIMCDPDRVKQWDEMARMTEMGRSEWVRFVLDKECAEGECPGTFVAKSVKPKKEVPMKPIGGVLLAVTEAKKQEKLTGRQSVVRSMVPTMKELEENRAKKKLEEAGWNK